MGADQPILLRDRCAAGNDPEILEFLRLTMNVTGSNWAELDLASEGNGDTQTFRLGQKGISETSIPLEVGHGYRANLRLGNDKPVTDDVLNLMLWTLANLIECFQLRTQSSLLRDAIDTASCSVMLFDNNGEIVYANIPADRLLSRQTENDLLADFNGGSKQPLLELLCNLVEQVATGNGFETSWKGSMNLDDGSIMACEVVLLRQSEGGSSSAVLVVLRLAGGEPEARIQTFASIFNLSPREKEVASLLLEGLATSKMAERLGISPHTIRDHLKRLYRKTGTKSRSELLGQLSGYQIAPVLVSADSQKPEPEAK